MSQIFITSQKTSFVTSKIHTTEIKNISTKNADIMDRKNNSSFNLYQLDSDILLEML